MIVTKTSRQRVTTFYRTCVTCGKPLRLNYGFCSNGLGTYLLCDAKNCPMENTIIIFVSDTE